MNAAFMSLERGWNDMNAASMSYEESAAPESAVTAVRERLCGTTGTAARRAHPFTMKIS
jgi:hypothetical protein